MWRYFGANGVGSLVLIDGNMTGNVYIQVLRNSLRQSAKKLGIIRFFMFYQDNDPKQRRIKHVTGCCTMLLKSWSSSPKSPDLNPIENVWDFLDKKLRQTPILCSTQLQQP